MSEEIAVSEFDSLAREAIKTFGVSAQLRQLKEELAELIVAVSHYERGREGSIEEVAEEYADVTFMLIQLDAIMGEYAQDKASDIMVHKFHRLRKRIAAHKVGK